MSAGSVTKKYVLHHDEYGQSVPVLETTDPEQAIKWLATRMELFRGYMAKPEPTTGFLEVNVTVVEEQIASTIRTIS